MYEDGADAADEELVEAEKEALEIPYWSIISYILYVAIFILILYPCVLMWLAQPHPNPESRLAEQAAPNFAQRIAQSKGSPIIITEDEINRHFEQECNLLQQGGYSILAHPESIMMDIHDGYAELIIDRMLGIDFHHTIRVNLSFERIEGEDYSSILCQLRGGDPLFNNWPRGGAIGSLPIPEHFMQMMVPVLKRILHIHPELQEIVEERGYLPVFSINEKGQGILQLTPPDQQLLSTNN